VSVARRFTAWTLRTPPYGHRGGSTVTTETFMIIAFHQIMFAGQTIQIWKALIKSFQNLCRLSLGDEFMANEVD